jgi:hypothetical protein
MIYSGDFVDIYIVAQIIGILGMAMNIISYQAKKQKNIIIIQFFGSLFFAINMFMIEAYTGAFLNAVGILRALIYANKEKIKYIKIANILFILIYLLSYVFTFVFLNKPVIFLNLIVELLPVIAMISTTISFSMETAGSVRKFAFISSPSWLIYNCVNFAIGGILCEVFSLVSVVIASIRLDKKGGKNG